MSCPTGRMRRVVTSRSVQRHLIPAVMRADGLSWYMAARKVLSFTVASRWAA